MYKEPINVYSHETFKYGRRSRSDDPLLTVEEILERHDKILDEYAEKYLGGKIPEENSFQEIGSAESIKERPEITKMLKAIESPAIKAILVVDVQRLSRGDLEDAGKLIRLLRYTNTLVITPHRTYDLRDEYDRDAFERELKKGNEYLEYYKKIQARGKLASVREGNYVGSVAPYGFNRKKIKDGKKDCYTLEEKEDEANIVRMIFEWYCNEDIGVTAICRRLESLNIKTKSNGTRWKPSIIFSILENVHYIGCVRWNWRKTVKIIEDQEVKILRPKAKIDEYLIFDGKHEGIISEAMFNKAREIRGTRHRTKTDTTLKNPLSGIMFCKCGSKIGYNTYNKDGVEFAPPKLVCNNQVHCKTGSVEFKEIMDYICESIFDCIKDFESRIDENQDDSLKLHKTLVENLEKKLKEIEKKELLQWEAQYDPDPSNRMPPHIFKKLNEQLLLEKDEIRQALCQAKESVPNPIDYRKKSMQFKQAYSILKDDNISAKIKNQYLRDIIDRITYTRPPIVRITKKNANEYNAEVSKGIKYHSEPYVVRITLK